MYVYRGRDIGNHAVRLTLIIRGKSQKATTAKRKSKPKTVTEDEKRTFTSGLLCSVYFPSISVPATVII